MKYLIIEDCQKVTQKIDVAIISDISQFVNASNEEITVVELIQPNNLGMFDYRTFEYATFVRNRLRSLKE